MASFTQKQWQEVEEILNGIVELFNLNRVPVAQGYAAISIMKRKMVESEPYLKEFDRAVDTCPADPISGGPKIWEPSEPADTKEKVH